MDDLSLSYAFTTTGAPVQAEGTVAGHRFYFRARYDRWSFGLTEDPAADPVDVESAAQGFYCEGEAGGPFAASWMPLDEAEALIRRCAREYLERRNA